MNLNFLKIMLGDGMVVLKKPRGTVVVRHHRGLPRCVRVFPTLPRRAVIGKGGNVVYHVSDGIYYQRRSPGYVVVRPAPGLRA